MANIKSAEKRNRTAEKSRQRNQAVRSGIRTARRQFMEVAEGADAAVKDGLFRTYCSVLDKAVKYGVIKKNTAVRRKTRAANRIRPKPAV